MAKRKKIIPIVDVTTCSVCKFVDIGLKDDAGVCRRYPPEMVNDGENVRSFYVIISPDDWCGEFSRKLQG